MKFFRRRQAEPVDRQLYTFFRSSTSFRLRIALAYKGLDYEPHYVSLPKMEHRAAAYQALNPQRLLPLLIDGGRRYTQSMAIVEYLDEAYPEPPLMPRDIEGRSYVRTVSQIIGCEMHPLNNVRVLKHLKTQFGADDTATKTWYAHWITEGFRSLEDYFRETHRHGAYCLGDSVTMADICLVPQVFNAARFDCSVDDYPILKGIFERCMDLGAFRDTQPSTQPDAF
jgi:maleylacetoacetate isomerase